MTDEELADVEKVSPKGAAEIRRLKAHVFNPKNYPWEPYDPSASDAERIRWLEQKLDCLAVEDMFHVRWLDALSDMTHEIARSTEIPAAENPRPGRPSTLATWWRWRLWMDCMADVPEEIELCLQGLVGAAFDSARAP